MDIEFKYHVVSIYKELTAHLPPNFQLGDMFRSWQRLEQECNLDLHEVITTLVSKQWNKFNAARKVRNSWLHMVLSSDDRAAV